MKWNSFRVGRECLEKEEKKTWNENIKKNIVAITITLIIQVNQHIFKTANDFWRERLKLKEKSAKKK